MATRGAKPKAAVIRLVTGTHRKHRHGDADAVRERAERSAQAFGPLVRPKYLSGDALAAWKEWIEPASWLDGSRGAAAILFCELWGQYRFAPASFPSSKIARIQSLMSELGLTDDRNRNGAAETKEADEFGLD